MLSFQKLKRTQPRKNSVALAWSFSAHQSLPVPELSGKGWKSMFFPFPTFLKHPVSSSVFPCTHATQLLCFTIAGLDEGKAEAFLVLAACHVTCHMTCSAPLALLSHLSSWACPLIPRSIHYCPVAILPLRTSPSLLRTSYY